MNATVLILSALMLVAGFGKPQAAQPPETINVSVVVSTEDDRAVTGLSLQDFRLFEDQTEQTLQAIKENRLAGDYTLTYTPTNLVRDGRFRRVRVEIVRPGSPKLTVRHSQGYVAK
jgi:hypothetical protein